MFKTITAKFAGTCKRCNGTIAAGQTIRYGGPGRTYHLAAVCGARSLMPDADDDTPIATPPAPTPQALMSATIAANLAQTFTGLLAQPARLGDIETRDQAQPDPTPTPAIVTLPAPIADPIGGQQFLRNALAARKTPTTIARRRKTLAWTPPVSRAPISADDLL